MKKTAPRISDSAAEFYPTVFSSLNGGLEYTIDAFPTLYRRTLAELRGVFSAAELKLIIDVFISTALTPGLAGQHLALSVADGIALENLDKKWSVDAAAMKKKIETLTSFDAAVLEIWATGFRYGDAEVGEYVSALA